MKKLNKKGFTLVELLAVIVILGVLLLIAVPATQNIITTNKKKAFVRNIQLVANKLTTYKTLYSSETSKRVKNCIYLFGDDTLLWEADNSLDKGSLKDIFAYFYIDSNWNIYLMHARKANEFSMGISLAAVNRISVVDGEMQIGGNSIDKFVSTSSSVLKINDIDASSVVANKPLPIKALTSFLSDGSDFNNIVCEFR